MQQKAPSKDKNRRAADRGGERGNVSVIVFGAFCSMTIRGKIRGHGHRKERLMYLVIEGFVCKVWELKYLGGKKLFLFCRYQKQYNKNTI